MTLLAESPTPFQLLPRLSDEEYNALREDIRENGIRVPIDVDENGLILDGHHRSWAAAELGIEVPRRIVTGLDDQGKRNHARAVNAIRRHLSREQRREQVGQMRSEGQTIERIATTLGVPKSTVGDDLKQLSETGKLVQPETITGADGKERPAAFAPREWQPTTVAEFVELYPVLEYFVTAGQSIRVLRTGKTFWQANEEDLPGLIADLQATIVAETEEAVTITTETRTERAPQRRSLVDDAYKANTDLWKAIERIRTIRGDDRFTRNKADILAALQPSADLAIEVLKNLFNPSEKELS